MAKMTEDEVREFAMNLRNAAESVAQTRHPGFNLVYFKPFIKYTKVTGGHGNGSCLWSMTLDWDEVTAELNRQLPKK